MSKKGEMTPEEFSKILADPFYAITVHPMYTQEHEYLVTEEDFVSVAVRAMLEDDNGKRLEPEEIEQSVRDYMYRLLNNLKGINL